MWLPLFKLTYIRYWLFYLVLLTSGFECFETCKDNRISFYSVIWPLYCYVVFVSMISWCWMCSMVCWLCFEWGRHIHNTVWLNVIQRFNGLHQQGFPSGWLLHRLQSQSPFMLLWRQSPSGRCSHIPTFWNLCLTLQIRFSFPNFVLCLSLNSNLSLHA